MRERGGGGAGRTGVRLALLSGCFLDSSGLVDVVGADERRRIAVGLGFKCDISGGLALATLVLGEEVFLEIVGVVKTLL